MRLRVLPGGVIVVTAPVSSSMGTVESFVASRSKWIRWAVEKMRQFRRLPVSGRRDYLKHKEEARAFVHQRITHWNQFYQFPYGRVAIKNTKRTWGSCSRKGNLNFSYALLFLPRELADYVVVHELCHLKEHNHGRAFWARVAQTLPNYLQLRRELKRYMPRG
jgi:predicted metal-dependent hydrolase